MCLKQMCKPHNFVSDRQKMKIFLQYVDMLVDSLMFVVSQHCNAELITHISVVSLRKRNRSGDAQSKKFDAQ